MLSLLCGFKDTQQRTKMTKSYRNRELAHRIDIGKGVVQQEGSLGPWWREVSILVVGAELS